MRKMLFVILLALYALPSLAQTVNGVLETVDDKKVLKVWGTHEQRGYAHGYLLAEECKTVFDEYIIEHVCYGQAYVYNTMRTFFVQNYAVEENYQAETDGLLEGVADAGVSLYNDVLGRDIDATDMLAANTIVDLSQVLTNIQVLKLGCSSLSSWGESTAQDSTLLGNLVVTRMMDWDLHPALTENHLLLVNIPAELDEQNWLSLTFPGFLGCLSGINQNGICATLNVGNHTGYQTGEPFYPILFNVRNGIEAADYNGDDENNYSDIADAIEDRNRSAGTIVHVTQNNGPDSHPVIIESNYFGLAVRDTSGNSESPEIFGQNLVATNHFRTLYDPDYCYRYQAIADSLEDSDDITSDRSWNIMCNAAGIAWNLHTLQYIESADLLYWASAVGYSPGYQQEPTVFYPSQLFACESEGYTLSLPEFWVEDSTGIFDLTLDNADDISGGQFQFYYYWDIANQEFFITGINTTERTEGFNIFITVNNDPELYRSQISVSFADTTGLVIEPGTGSILEFTWEAYLCGFSVNEMNFTEALLYDEVFQPIQPETINGMFYMPCISVEDKNISTPPEKFRLHNNYPNPFNPTTTIQFDLPEKSDVNLGIYDISGKLVKTLINDLNTQR